jgi:Ca2+-binding RTX toxin-like protein
VGTLSADDPDAGETFTFSLVDDAGGLFAIDGNDIVVAGALDFETATTHEVTVRVTDSAGNTFDKVFTVNVSNVSGNFVGDNNANTLLGTSEEDTIQGLGANDSLQGFAGNDILDGGLGSDRAFYTDATGSITVDLAAGIVSGSGVGTDTLRSVEYVSGSNFADTFNAIGFSGTSANAGSTAPTTSSRAVAVTTRLRVTATPAYPMPMPRPASSSTSRPERRPATVRSALTALRA